ncbi:NUDIX hydrolase [Nocardia suismassiliense]|uniref:NUDIX hydrolase n=1 Tax=Nocardia suismassiliense TaxID=2077092 RepID=UPI000D1DCD54|nr:NUDIX hydrolase [Nocardia suismassiliense]
MCSGEYESEIWRVHGQRNIYKSEWVELWLDDVETPDGHRFEHHVLRYPRESVYALVIQNGKLLMMWRHRFITNAWGWEVPAGWVDLGESSEEAVCREVEEETGWRSKTPQLLSVYYAQSGMSNMRFSLYLIETADLIGDPTDISEASEIKWIPVSELSELVRTGKIKDGPCLLAITYYLAISASSHHP